MHLLEDGYVAKYYRHYYPNNPDATAGTEIQYTKYQLTSGGRLRTENYNAGFQLESTREYALEGTKVTLLHGTAINDKLDTVALDLLNGTMAEWDGAQTEPYQIRFESNDKKYIYTEKQLSVEDSILLDKPTKVFATEWMYQEEGSDSVFSDGSSKSYYVQGYGFFGADIKGFSYSRQIELIEQMSVAEFEKRASHGMHRVGWINPKESMSDDREFRLCGHEMRIADYYNSTPRGDYFHGKSALKDTVIAHLDKEKLFDQEGMLTFRFVVNCEGKAGRFIARGYDPHHQPMKFRKETVDHLFSIMQKLEEWRPVVLQDEARDAYFYYTFKIKDGEVTDILP